MDYWCLSSLYVLDISSRSDIALVKNFSQSVGCSFVLLTMSFDTQKLFCFMKSHLVIIVLSLCTNVFCSESLVLCQWVQGNFHTFSSLRFIISDLTLTPLFNLELSIMQAHIFELFYSSTCKHPVWPAPFVENTVFLLCVYFFML